MRNCHVIVEKILFHNKQNAFGVFQGIVLRWAPRKKEYVKTGEKQTFSGYFLCLFLGDHLEVEAEEIMHKQYGPQYVVKTSKRFEPVTISEIRNFFIQNVKGIGPALTNKILDQYGADALKAIQRDPHAYDFLKLPQDTIDKMRSDIMANGAFEDTLVYLQLHNIDCRYALPLHKKYGDKAGLIMSSNPYLPYIENIFDFKTADQLYLSLNMKPDSSTRCIYVTFAMLQNDSETCGNTFIPKNKLREKIGVFLDGNRNDDRDHCPFSNDDIEHALTFLVEMGKIVLDKDGSKTRVYLRANFQDERRIPELLSNFMTDPKRLAFDKKDIADFLTQYEITTGMQLAPAQKDAVMTALTSPISIISGGPGTGKTQTINTIYAAIRALAPKAEIRACAPTGKAAIRISEITGISAATIHRTISLNPYQPSITGGTYVCDVLFVDEFSMADIHLCASLLDAVNTCGRIVFVGDYHQLPSVGPGLVLRDFIASNRIPKVILKQVFRQAGNSNIITNAHELINCNPGMDPQLKFSTQPGGDFYFLPMLDQEKILNTVIRSVKRMQQTYKSEQIQVLSSVHYGMLGTDNLNLVMQSELNKTQVAIDYREKEFCLHDKVVHTKNNYDLKVFNGEVGYISAILGTKKEALCVTYPDRDVWYPMAALEELELAYAMTVHKLQGSEFPVIIMPIHETQGISLSKNLIYTAFTRAKKTVVLIGDPNTLQVSLRRETSINRESNLLVGLQGALRVA